MAETPVGSLKRLLVTDYETSVFRRTLLLLALIIPAFAANFLVLYISAHWLGAAEFGVFYAANTISNILFSGSLILNLAFTRYLSGVLTAHGSSGLVAGTRKIQHTVLWWGGWTATGLALCGLIAGNQLGVRSAIVIVLIVLDAFTAYVGDVGRVLLQTARRTLALGFYTLVWMILRLLLCIAGLLWFGTVWGALAGIVLSSLLMIAAVNFVLLRCPSGANEPVGKLPTLTGELPALFGYGLLVTVSNLDILVGYFALPSVSFGIYAASSILPKAILTVLLPLQQMLFPHMLSGRSNKQADQRFRRKAALVVIGLAVAGTLFTVLIEPLACGEAPGILLCRPSLMNIILLGVAPLALVRVLLLEDIVNHRPFRAFLLLIPLVGFAVWTRRTAVSQEALMAWGYLGCCLVAVLLLVGHRLVPSLPRAN
ncbi:MAG TPA: hypothetical protein VE999_12040 [Gemmataceae bacterium]|nr:hypothetical protein [Reyranella sp.]HZV05804.1 hypothetical protein [Gemmataceae bacterium]